MCGSSAVPSPSRIAQASTSARAACGCSTVVVCALVAAADTAVVARGLMYTSVRQASADLASVVLGPSAAPVVAAVATVVG